MTYMEPVALRFVSLGCVGFSVSALGELSISLQCTYLKNSFLSFF